MILHGRHEVGAAEDVGPGLLDLANQEIVATGTRELVERRRRTAVRDRVLEEGVTAFSQGAADIGLGLVLLVSAGAIASGAFDLGTLALFSKENGILLPGYMFILELVLFRFRSPLFKLARLSVSGQQELLTFSQVRG